MEMELTRTSDGWEVRRERKGRIQGVSHSERKVTGPAAPGGFGPPWGSEPPSLPSVRVSGLVRAPSLHCGPRFPVCRPCGRPAGPLGGVPGAALPRIVRLPSRELRKGPEPPGARAEQGDHRGQFSCLVHLPPGERSKWPRGERRAAPASCPAGSPPLCSCGPPREVSRSFPGEIRALPLSLTRSKLWDLTEPR